MNQLPFPHIIAILSGSLLFMNCTAYKRSESPFIEFPRQVRVEMQKETKGDRTWSSAKYRELTIGQSTRNDMFRVFGKPTRSFIPDEPDQIWYEYNNSSELFSTLTVRVDQASGNILEMILSPRNLLSKEDAINRFGDDYIVTRYDFCDETSDQTPPPLYESLRGPFYYVEYRSRGIALALNFQGQVDGVHYVSNPIGAASLADCRRK